jgi:hypothetical protein
MKFCLIDHQILSSFVRPDTLALTIRIIPLLSEDHWHRDDLWGNFTLEGNVDWAGDENG